MSASKKSLIFTVRASLLLIGCATAMQSYGETNAPSASQQGNFKAALAQLDGRNSSESAKKELLYNMERGELLRLDRQYPQSTEAFLAADAKVQEWEAAAKTDPQRLLGMLGAATISESFKTYEGQDYEKVWLTTRLALNRMSQSDYEQARVDVKRTHEREAVIADLRAKEIAAAEEEAKAKGAQAKTTELNGYPIETLNDPEVLALKNGYQNALSHYLAGFLYESLNEPGMAAPGYRKAIELRPGVAALEEGLSGLDARTSLTWKRRQRLTDVLFVIDTGSAPVRKPQAFTVPIPTTTGLRTVSISYPVIEPSKDVPLSDMKVDDKIFPLSSVVDMNVMARRALKDEMPGMMVRNVTRAITKAVAQEQLQKHAGLFGALVGAVASVATEKADDRMWRTLPGRVYVARMHLPPGEHQITIGGVDFGKITVDGQYALVPLRLYEALPLVGDIGAFGKLPEFVVPVQAEPAVVTADVTTDAKVNLAEQASRSASPKKAASKKSSAK